MDGCRNALAPRRHSRPVLPPWKEHGHRWIESLGQTDEIRTASPAGEERASSSADEQGVRLAKPVWLRCCEYSLINPSRMERRWTLVAAKAATCGRGWGGRWPSER